MPTGHRVATVPGVDSSRKCGRVTDGNGAHGVADCHTKKAGAGEYS